MDAFVKQGIIFSVVMVILFGIISGIGYSPLADKVDPSTRTTEYGFPLPFHKTTIACPPPEYSGEGCELMGWSNELNLALNLVIAIIIGFGISYVKGTMVKK